LKRLETESKQFGIYRKKHRAIWSYLKKTAKVIISLSGTISSAVSLTPFAPAVALVGAVVFHFDSATGVSEIYDWIKELFADLGQFTDRSDEYIQGGLPPRLQAIVTRQTCPERFPLLYTHLSRCRFSLRRGEPKCETVLSSASHLYSPRSLPG
jgi:hypothetical protein